jgi:hypothetical protein
MIGSKSFLRLLNVFTFWMSPNTEGSSSERFTSANSLRRAAARSSIGIMIKGSGEMRKENEEREIREIKD